MTALEIIGLVILITVAGADLVWLIKNMLEVDE